MEDFRDRFALPISIAMGAALPLAFAPFGAWILAPVCLAGLFFCLEDARPGLVFVRSLGFGLSSFLGGTYWTFISVNEFGGAPLPLSIAAMLGLVVVLALFFAVAVTVAARYLHIGGAHGRLVILPAVWVVGEWCRGWMFTGFGWLSVGYSQTDTWLMGLAPVFGLHGLGMSVALSAGALLSVAVGARPGRTIGCVMLVAIWGIGWLLSGWRWTQPQPGFLNVAIAQGAISQDRKWLREQYAPTLELYRDLSVSAAGHDLIVWPEVAVPNVFSGARDYLESVQAEVSAGGGIVMTGVLLRDAQGNAQNSLVAMTPEPQFYSKRHLVPFGEYFPVPGFARDWLRLLDLPYSDLGTGAAEQPPIEIDGEIIAVSICYEDVFSEELLPAFPEATLIVNISNDAWFGRSIAADQHLQIARMRAAEVGRYAIRSTNTGVSAVIDPLGTVVEAGPSFEPVLLSATVQGFTGATPYVGWGNYPVMSLAFAMLVSAAFTARRRD